MYKLINNEMTLHIQMLQADWMIINYMIEPTYHGLELLSVGLFSCGLAYKLQISPYQFDIFSVMTIFDFAKVSIRFLEISWAVAAHIKCKCDIL